MKATVVHAKNAEEWKELLEFYKDSICSRYNISYEQDRCLIISNQMLTYGTQNTKIYFEISSDDYTIISFEEWLEKYKKEAIYKVGQIWEDAFGDKYEVLKVKNNGRGTILIKNVKTGLDIYFDLSKHKSSYTLISPTKERTFEVGKWYEITNNIATYYVKITKVDSDISGYFCLKGKYDFKLTSIGAFSTKGIKDSRLITDLTEIQEYLPEGHPDKVSTTMPPEEDELKVGDVIYVTDPSYSEDFFMLGRVLSLDNGDSDERFIRGNADFISSNNNLDQLERNRSWNYKTTNGVRTYRKATQPEIKWLDYCLLKDKYVSYEDFLKYCGRKPSKWVKTSDNTTWEKIKGENISFVSRPLSIEECFPPKEEPKFKTKRKGKTIFSTFVDSNLPTTVNLVKVKTKNK